MRPVNQPTPSGRESYWGWSSARRRAGARPTKTSYLRRVGGQAEHDPICPGCAAGATQLDVVELDLSSQANILDYAKGRDVLRYLVRCAFADGTEAAIRHDGETLAFRGSVGLAPAWESRALTTEEARWVSACLYALTNKSGKHVQVSLRGDHPKLDADTLSAQERQTFTLHEGGFFGNFFADEPVAYACQGDGLIQNPQAAVFRDRVCAMPASITGADSEPVSQCGFILTGSCAETSSVVFQGTQYDEVVHVYLRAE